MKLEHLAEAARMLIALHDANVEISEMEQSAIHTVTEQVGRIRDLALYNAHRDGMGYAKLSALTGKAQGVIRQSATRAKKLRIAKRNSVPADEVDNLSVERLILNTRVVDLFLQYKIKTVGDLRKHSQADLLKLPQLGAVSLRNIRAALAPHGVDLRLA